MNATLEEMVAHLRENKVADWFVRGVEERLGDPRATMGTSYLGFMMPVEQAAAVLVDLRGKGAVSAIAVLAHEMTHVATHLLDARGVEISRENDEPLAYLQEYLLAQALCHIAFD